MTQILIVDQATGIYYNVDSTGHKVVDDIDEVTGINDCSVFMERMMAGHIDLPLNHQAVQLNLAERGWEVARVIRYKDGSLTLASTEFKSHMLDPILHGDYYALAIHDYEAEKFFWLDNPIGNGWTTGSYDKASVVSIGSVGDDIMKLAKSQLLKLFPVHVSVIDAVLQ